MRAGDESKVMMEAHTDAGFVVGEPFGHEGLYDFGGHGTLTKRVTQLGGVMMQHRWAAGVGSGFRVQGHSTAQVGSTLQ